MEYKEVTFKNNAIKRFYALVAGFILAISVAYTVFPKSFWMVMIGGGIYVLAVMILQTHKYIFTTNNTIESHHFFGKINSRKIDIDKILEMRIEKMNQLTIKYIKDGYSQPTSFIMELNDQDMKNAQHEILKRNPSILSHYAENFQL